jgi:hypothetical protein
MFHDLATTRAFLLPALHGKQSSPHETPFHDLSGMVTKFAAVHDSIVLKHNLIATLSTVLWTIASSDTSRLNSTLTLLFDRDQGPTAALISTLEDTDRSRLIYYDLIVTWTGDNTVSQVNASTPFNVSTFDRT